MLMRIRDASVAVRVVLTGPIMIALLAGCASSTSRRVTTQSPQRSICDYVTLSDARRVLGPNARKMQRGVPPTLGCYFGTELSAGLAREPAGVRPTQTALAKALVVQINPRAPRPSRPQPGQVVRVPGVASLGHWEAAPATVGATGGILSVPVAGSVIMVSVLGTSSDLAHAKQVASSVARKLG
jgi:hypothetical protein